MPSAADGAPIDQDISGVPVGGDPPAVVLRPHIAVRFGTLIPTGCIAAAFVCAWAQAQFLTGLAVSLPVIAICALVAVRSIFYAGAICTQDQLVVRGMLWSRRISRSAIDEVTGSWAVVVWRGRGLGRRFTPMTGFFTGNSAQWLDDYNSGKIRLIRMWVKAGPEYQPIVASEGRH